MQRLEDWAELSPGIYLHRWLPRLLLVRPEIMRSMRITDTLTEDEWTVLAGRLLDHARIHHAEVRDMRIELSDVEVVSEVTHA